MYNIDCFITCKMQRKQCRIKLQVAYTGVSIKSREKTSHGFWQGTGKIAIVWVVFSGNGDEDLFLPSFSHYISGGTQDLHFLQCTSIL